MTDEFGSEKWELIRVTSSIRMRDLAPEDSLIQAMTRMAPEDELHLADILGVIDRLHKLPSRYPDAAGNPGTNILLEGRFQAKFPDDREKLASTRLWLPPDYSAFLARCFEKLAVGETLPITISIYAVNAARKGRQYPYFYRVRPGTLAQQSARELRRVKLLEGPRLGN